tara:strand:+ start:249 stop:572 length:324 start_codon:yes stop_codon:yes gene_type:complete
MAKEPRVKVPKTAKKGEIIQIKTLVYHQMNSGFGKDQDGNTIPRMIINKFVCAFNGNQVFSVDMHPSLSANPFFVFHARVEENGTFEFNWTDDNGESVKAARKITVS